jgi:hypothetical protein
MEDYAEALEKVVGASSSKLLEEIDCQCWSLWLQYLENSSTVSLALKIESLAERKAQTGENSADIALKGCFSYNPLLVCSKLDSRRI